MVEVKSRRVGGANYQVPVEVSSQRKMRAVHARNGSSSTPVSVRVGP